MSHLASWVSTVVEWYTGVTQTGTNPGVKEVDLIFLGTNSGVLQHLVSVPIRLVKEESRSS